ncbi:Lon protease [Iodidimonas nitroreducens]|uniref:Lon protease n=1 Tax=Iodidimonas nitroreducens TaxID=1236968 RepID=A0A5A7N6V6_9PROT|nr:endopeptidase La [Iodidimonas nitroreducens]GER03100.1 Lon protease [Iodidimonas nitroreducens]
MDKTYPVLPLRDIVVFPHMIVPLFVGREKSVRALEEVMKDDRPILLVSQKNAGEDDPSADDIYEMGTLANVLQLLRLPDGTVKVLVEGSGRARITRFVDNEEFFEASIEDVEEVPGNEKELQALKRSVISQFEHYVKLNKKIAPEVLVSANQIDDPSKLADTVASHLALKIADKQDLLSTHAITDRLEKVYAFMEGEIGVLQVEKKIRGRVKRQMEKTQREYYLNEQLKAIQKELGETDESREETADLEKRIAETKLSKEAREKCISELKKLKSMSPMSAEATVVRNYLDWVLGMPWGKRTRVKKDIGWSEQILDADHYGLDKVKERIVEYLAVLQRANKIKGPILCLVGPPGVGKTSLGRSIAKATGRNFIRFSLGGVRDEAEIRGHRRTYIGSMPGKVMQNMKKAGSANPLFLLDEIDKMGQDFRGDPASALLEVLDPEQNSHFNDHYLEVDYDLSDVMFVTTANSLSMPQPLLDRMEIIHLSGYTEDEKLEIAKRHLIPKQVKDHGLRRAEWSISDGALRDLIRYYTREAGVRSLERMLARLMRKAVKEIVEGKRKRVQVTAQNVGNYAGIKRYRYGQAEVEDQVGLTTGLAWTEVGGEILSIEAVTTRGKGRILTTGKLGSVMQESIQAARSFVHSRAASYGVKQRFLKKATSMCMCPKGPRPRTGHRPVWRW